MRSIKLTLSYDGTEYAGWQVQSNQQTIQDTLERAIQTITAEPSRTVASGRTDAGVHALGQVVSFVTHSSLPCDVLQNALNGNLPRDVHVLEARDAPQGFHAIRDAVRKTYRYVIQDGEPNDIFSRRYSWHIPQRLDAQAMHDAAQLLLGTHDFSSFETSGSQRASSIRTIEQIGVQRVGTGIEEKIVCEVTADGFLYNMVRAIVGTLVEIGKNNFDVKEFQRILLAVDRREAGMTAPPQGLFLVNVDYEM